MSIAPVMLKNGSSATLRMIENTQEALEDLQKNHPDTLVAFVKLAQNPNYRLSPDHLHNLKRRFLVTKTGIMDPVVREIVLSCVSMADGRIVLVDPRA